MQLWAEYLAHIWIAYIFLQNHSWKPVCHRFFFTCLSLDSFSHPPIFCKMFNYRRLSDRPCVLLVKTFKCCFIASFFYMVIIHPCIGLVERKRKLFCFLSIKLWAHLNYLLHYTISIFPYALPLIAKKKQQAKRGCLPFAFSHVAWTSILSCSYCYCFFSANEYWKI